MSRHVNQPETLSDRELSSLIAAASDMVDDLSKKLDRARKSRTRLDAATKRYLWVKALLAAEELQRRREGEPARVTSGERFAGKMVAQTMELDSMLEVFK